MDADIREAADDEAECEGEKVEKRLGKSVQAPRIIAAGAARVNVPKP